MTIYSDLRANALAMKHAITAPGQTRENRGKGRLDRVAGGDRTERRSLLRRSAGVLSLRFAPLP